MSETLNLGAGNWGVKDGSLLGYNSENGNFKPLPFNFTRATSATRVNKDGLIEVVTNNKPRIDFKDDANGALLLEPERRNLITYSEDFNSWSKSGTVNIETGVLSPAGDNSANTLSGGGDLIINATTIVASTHIFSIWVKGNIGDSFRFQKSGSFSYAQNTITIDSSDWKRYEISRDFNVATGQIVIDSFDEGLSFWGAQLEAGSYATSYIPTQGSQVTRVQEVCSQTPPSGIIGQTEGTVFLDFKPFNDIDGLRYISFENSSSVSNGWFGVFSGLNSGLVRFRFFGDGWNIYSSFAIEKGLRYKVAFSYKNGIATSIYINGTFVNSITASLSGKSFQKIRLSEAAIGSRGDADFKDIKLYDTIKTDQELQQLTSL